MRRIAFLVLALSLTGFPLAEAQQANFNYQGTQTAVVVPTLQTFTNAFPLQPGRQSCWIEYVAAPGSTPGDLTLGWVYFGSSPTSIASFQLSVRQFLNCEQANEAEGGAIWLAATVTAGTFVIKVK